MQINRFCSVIAILGVMIMTLAIAGCGTKTVSVAEVTYKDMPLQIHNDANVMCLGARTLGCGLACELAEIFLTTGFEGGRHQRRIDLITAIENKQ